MAPSTYSVSLQFAAPRTIAAVHARLAPGAVPGAFRRYLDQVYAFAQAGRVAHEGRNVFLYQDAANGMHDVAFGVGVPEPFAPVGAVVPTSLPSGDVAMTTHWGSYAQLGAAHDAIIAWCRDNGLGRAGPRWEVYDHWTDDETRLRTDVFYLLQPAAADAP